MPAVQFSLVYWIGLVVALVALSGEATWPAIAIFSFLGMWCVIGMTRFVNWTWHHDSAFGRWVIRVHIALWFLVIVGTVLAVIGRSLPK